MVIIIPYIRILTQLNKKIILFIKKKNLQRTKNHLTDLKPDIINPFQISTE